MKLNIKNAIRLCAVALLTMCLLTVTVLAASRSSSHVTCSNSDKAYAIYLYNSTTGKALFDQNSDKLIAPASTVKLMTALVTFDTLSDVNNVTVTQKMVDGLEGNLLGLKVGENISVKDLLIGLVCGGYNDAAQALAIASYGSVDAFVAEMNKKAAELGAAYTTYKEPTGIDDSAQTTARDTAIIAEAFMNNATLSEYSSLPSYEISATNKSEKRHIYNRNALISAYTGSTYLNANAIGMNAGMTSAGGYCVVTGIRNGGMSYVCVVMGATYGKESNTIYSYKIANELLKQISRLDLRTVISQNETVGEIPIEGAKLDKKTVAVRPATDVTAYLPADYETSGKLEYDYVYSKESIIAPVKEGDTVGKVVVSYEDEIVSVCDLVIAEDVERDAIIYALFLIRSFITNRVFILIVLSFVLMLIIRYYILNRSHKRNKRHRRY